MKVTIELRNKHIVLTEDDLNFIKEEMKALPFFHQFLKYSNTEYICLVNGSVFIGIDLKLSNEDYDIIFNFKLKREIEYLEKHFESHYLNGSYFPQVMTIENIIQSNYKSDCRKTYKQYLLPFTMELQYARSRTTNTS